MHSHDVSSDDLVGEAGEDQSECFTRTQDLAQDTKGVFRTLCLATRVYHVNNWCGSTGSVEVLQNRPELVETSAEVASEVLWPWLWLVTANSIPLFFCTFDSPESHVALTSGP